MRITAKVVCQMSLKVNLSCYFHCIYCLLITCLQLVGLNPLYRICFFIFFHKKYLNKEVLWMLILLVYLILHIAYNYLKNVTNIFLPKNWYFMLAWPYYIDCWNEAIKCDIWRYWKAFSCSAVKQVNQLFYNQSSESIHQNTFHQLN